MIICVRIGGFVTRLTHPVHTGDFGASIVADMNNIVHALIGAGIYCDVGVRVLGCAEDDEVTGGKLTAIYIGCACTDLLDLTSTHKIVQRLLPCDHGLGVPSGSVNGFSDIRGIHTFNVRQIVQHEIRDKGGTA